ncbi:Retrovirus-related Pol polyprotein from transposon RE2 [Sesamum angolense]|uniref:Retrovirus-related Pol polyprotein from transposon RE2 n=1 Tax=Sesamum angolense TaxID=2727404 RepID=A0AAE2BPD6_9LAMI|nr:Retrovirus-related Pol polyprotein from transposon RE2 [Sesamum angolense]
MDEEIIAELVRGELKSLLEEQSLETLNGTRMGAFEDFADVIGKETLATDPDNLPDITLDTNPCIAQPEQDLRRWIFKLKLKADGTVDKYKACLVAKGYTQVEGIDYVDNFSPMAKAVIVRMLLAFAASKNWLLHHVDVNNAFFVDSYKKCNLEFTSKIEAFDFVQSEHDHCLFTKSSTFGLTILLIYVDDILIIGESELCLKEIKSYLNKLFTIKDLGTSKYYLGVELARSSEGLVITQAKHIKDLITDAGMTQAKLALTPLPTGIKFSTKGGHEICSTLDLVAYTDADWASCVDTRSTMASITMVGRLAKGIDYKLISVGLVEFEPSEGIVFTILPPMED